jgi:DNA polymerase-3 subunit alpha
MAAVLSNNMGNLEKITFFMEEARRIGIPVLGPDVNESDVKFSVNQKGQIRYALSAIKGVGDAAVAGIVEERKAAGPFTSIFNLTKRVNLRTVNKKSIENLALAGAFDGFGKYTRSQFVMGDPRDGMNLTDKCIKWGNSEQSSKSMNQNSLFGGAIHTDASEPILMPVEEWPMLEKLKKEKDVVGIYISGHPLDNYKLEINTFTNCTLKQLPESKDKELKLAGIISSTQTKVSKTGNQFVIFTLEDFEGTFEFALFGKDYIQFKNYVETMGALLYITGRYQARFNQPDNFEFKISKIELLPDIRTKLTKRLTIKVSAEKITERVTDELLAIFGKYPGKYPISVKLKSDEEQISISLNSRKVTVDISNEMLAELHTMEEMEFALN